jgi:YVTN family beta-propeller protein
VVDLASSSVVANVAVGAEPLGVAISPDGRRVWVTCFASSTLVAIDTASNAVVARANVGQSPRAIALTPDGRFAWLTHSDAALSIVDLSRVGGP